MYKALQKQLKPRMLAFLLVSLILLTITAGYLYVLKQPVKNYRQAQQTLALLETEMEAGIPMGNQVELFQQQNAQLHQQLYGNSHKLPLNQMIAFVIGQMDRIARTHEIKLVSVEPGNIEKIFMFQELPFHVAVTGNYFRLFDWLDQVESDLGPIVIKEFEITSEPNSTVRRFMLTLVSYQFAEQL